MEVTLYSNFSKRRNTTKQPTSGGTVKNLVLKGECSYTNPSFFLADTEKYTYLKAWDNYYFIDERSYDINGASYITCSIDVRASFKTEILNTTAFVKYSSSNYDQNIIDGRVSQLITNMGIDSSSTFTIQESPFYPGHGCYILTVMNNTVGQCTYALEKSTLDLLLQDMSNISLADIADFFAMQFGDVAHSVFGLRYIPIRRTDLDIEQLSAVVRIGTWLASGEDIAGTIVNPHFTHTTPAIAIPWTYSDFRRYGGFTNLTIGLPFVGKVSIDPLEIINESSIKIRTDINIVTGVGSYTLQRGSSSLAFATYSFSCGRNVPMSYLSSNFDDAVTGLVTGASGIIGGANTPDTRQITTKAGVRRIVDNPLHTSDVNSVMNGLSKATLAPFEHTTTSIGSYGGGFSEYGIRNYEIINVSRQSRTDPSELTALYGRPCNKVLTISSLSGYVETVGFSIDINETDLIKYMINEAMDSGTYLE